MRAEEMFDILSPRVLLAIHTLPLTVVVKFAELVRVRQEEAVAIMMDADLGLASRLEVQHRVALIVAKISRDERHGFQVITRMPERPSRNAVMSCMEGMDDPDLEGDAS